MGVLDLFARDDLSAPLGGKKAWLRRSDANPYEIALGPDGRATVEAAAGQYWLRIDRVVRELELLAGTREPVELVVPRGGVIQGTVAGPPDAQYRLRIVRTRDSRTSETMVTIRLDEQRRFEHAEEAGSVVATVLADTASSLPQTIVVPPGGVAEATFAVGAAPPAIVGCVRAAGDGRPIAGAKVEADGIVVETDAAGMFAIGLPSVPEQVTVRAPWFTARTIKVDATRTPPMRHRDRACAGRKRAREGRRRGREAGRGEGADRLVRRR